MKIMLVKMLWLGMLVPYAIASAIECPGNANCSCQKDDWGEYKLSCPIDTQQPALITTLQPEKYVQLQCTVDMKNWEELKLISGLNVSGPVNSFTLKLCPLPGISIKELMSSIGIPKAESIQIVNSNLSNILTNNHLEGLQEVTTLNLTMNHITELPEDIFKGLGNITRLDLQNNHLKLHNGIFKYVPKLEVLELGGNNLNHLEPGLFRNLTNLRMLNLWGNKLQNLTRAVFSDLPNLENIDLTSNGLTTLQPDIFADLINLKLINLANNEFLSLPQNLFRSNTALERIQLVYNRVALRTVPPGFLANLKELKYVSLRGMKISYLPEDLLWGCSSLDNLNLQDNFLQELQENIFRDIIEVTIINLSSNKLSNLPDFLFSNLKNLKTLDLSHNMITNISSNLFGKFFNLETLIISHNEIKYIHEKAFVDVTNLKNVDFSYNNMINFHQVNENRFIPKVSFLNTCHGLRNINLSHNKLSILYRDWLYIMYNLKTIDLSYNDFTELNIYNFETFTSSLEIDFSHNKISTIAMDEAEKFAQMKYEGIAIKKDTELSSTKVTLKNNPLMCDCNNYHLIKYFKGMLNREVNFIAVFDGSGLTCTGPKELKGIDVKHVDLSLISCPIKNVLPNLSGCPQQCSCYYRPNNATLIVDCSNKGLRYVPKFLPTTIINSDWMKVNHTELYLNKNKLRTITDEPGKGYNKVSILNLSHNKLIKINLTSFSPQLKVINLHNNNFTRLDNKTMNTIINSKYIKEVTIRNNPWLCTCETKELVSFVLDGIQKISDHKNTTCSNGIELMGNTIDKLCSVTNSYIIITLLAVIITLTILSILVAVYYRYQNEIKVWLYAHQSCLCLITEDDLDKDKKYDVFISYSHLDEKFIVDELVPGLENGETKYKTCLHYRDWVAGEYIPSSIAQSVEESRRTVIVLSKNFVDSIWGRVEFQTAHKKAILEGRARIVILLIDEVEHLSELDSSMRTYLKMNTYIKWGEPGCWKKLHRALSHPSEQTRKIPLLTENGVQQTMNGTVPNGTLSEKTTPIVDRLIIEPLKTLANSKPV